MRPTALSRLADFIESRMLVINISSSDAAPQNGEKNRRDTLLSGSPGSGDARNAAVVVTGATFPVEGSERNEPERADAKEMRKELYDIVAEAKRGRLLWINFDGMADASNLGIPKVPDRLTPDPKARLARARSKDQLNSSVRDHHALLRFSQLSLASG